MCLSPTISTYGCVSYSSFSFSHIYYHTQLPGLWLWLSYELQPFVVYIISKYIQ